jgi:predicted  nucleic acid-binding Zn-ribbon protein
LIKLISCSLVIAVLMLAVACGDDDDETTDSASTGTPEAATVCEQADSVQQAVEALSEVQIAEEGTNALNAAVADIKTETDELKETASAEVEDEVQALSDSIDEAEEILSGIDDDATLNERIDDVQSAVTGVVTAAAGLPDALSEECS